MSFDPLSLLSIGTKLIDKLIPDPAQKAAAQLELMRAEREGELAKIKTDLSAILAEAQSADPYTSRARPSFLYVVYILILWCIPMGVMSIFNPEAAAAFATGVKSWLQAIPEHLWEVFGFVMGGYIFGRSLEKMKGVK